MWTPAQLQSEIRLIRVWPDTVFCHDNIHRNVVRLRVDCREPRKGKADADDQRLRRSGRNGSVIEAPTIAEAVSGRIEADERCDQNVRIDGLTSAGMGMFQTPRVMRSPGDQVRNWRGRPFSTTIGSASRAPSSRIPVRRGLASNSPLKGQ